MSRASNLNKHAQYGTRAGRIAAADDALAQVPLSVTTLVATQTGATTMNLTWANPADQLAGVNVRIERSPNDNLSFALIDIVPAADAAFADSGLVTATAYFYRVTAVEETGQATASPEASDTTA